MTLQIFGSFLRFVREADLEGSLSVRSVSRRGDKQASHPRLLRAVLGSMDQRDTFLYKIRTVYPTDGPITFFIDRPKPERDEYKKLLQELKSKEESGDHSWEIRKLKLVKKKPFRGTPPQGGHC